VEDVYTIVDRSRPNKGDIDLAQESGTHARNWLTQKGCLDPLDGFFWSPSPCGLQIQ